MATQQAAATVTGYVSSDPLVGGTETFKVLSFRIGSTRSRFNTATNSWEDIGTAWLTVKAYRMLAQNAQSSLRRGDRVIVVGLLNTEQWTNEQGVICSRIVLEASNIGHDLTVGTTQLCKPRRNNAQGAQSDQVTAGAPGISSAGNPNGIGADPYAAAAVPNNQPVDLGVAPPDTPSPETSIPANGQGVPSTPSDIPNPTSEPQADNFADNPDPTASEF
ncbi:single-stranded DNA-binding protein [Bifidobacterium oedipodis]|uniref:Single-stranded DNA-binding protein n=1 Tax=Bifidobacterium oedipodis TaxID=2675322 RepID=A0A7Y0HTE7_9BIFI|nr:single-stranded DNA-binding protein [Bifidobacterium sp. DSM 109957]NMM94037.1 single-stranded DNA-binding protein [Bifidobacterium sp. DSM 109957]